MAILRNNRFWTGLLASFMVLLMIEPAAAQTEKQIGKAEISNLSVGRYRRLAMQVDETVQRGFMEYTAAPKGYSFVVLWMDLKLTPGKDEDGDAKTYIPGELVTFQAEGGKTIKSIGSCTRDGRMNASYYSYGYSYYGVPEKETLPYSIVVVVPDDVNKFKFNFGSEAQDVEAPSQVEDTIDRTAGAVFKVAKMEVVDKLERKQRIGDYDMPLGDAVISAQGASAKFLIVQLYVKGKVSNTSEGGFQLQSGDLGVLFGSEVYCQPIGAMADDEFEPGYAYIHSQQDVIGDFSTAAVRLVFPLPGRVTKFKLMYLMQPIAELDVPK